MENMFNDNEIEPNLSNHSYDDKKVSEFDILSNSHNNSILNNVQKEVKDNLCEDIDNYLNNDSNALNDINQVKVNKFKFNVNELEKES